MIDESIYYFLSPPTEQTKDKEKDNNNYMQINNKHLHKQNKKKMKEKRMISIRDFCIILPFVSDLPLVWTEYV